ncbi:hypothetical protein BDW75DRAFT_228879 [Aspergillus navahoensis]
MGSDFVFIHVHEPKDPLRLAKGSHIHHLASGEIVRQSQPAGGTQAFYFGFPIPNPLGGLRGDPFWSHPVHGGLSCPGSLITVHLMSMAVDIPELDQPRNRGLLRTDWFPLVMTEPSLFLVIVLLAASNYASVQTESTYMKLHLLGLRCEAVQVGLQRAVELRGGLDALGLGGLLRRIVIWIDRNGAFLNGRPYISPGETFAPGQPLPDPNPGHFLGAQ